MLRNNRTHLFALFVSELEYYIARGIISTLYLSVYCINKNLFGHFIMHICIAFPWMLQFALVCPSKRSLKNISTQTVLWKFVVTCVYMFLLHKYCIIYNAHASFYCFVFGNHLCMLFISIFTVFLYLQAVVALHVWGKYIFTFLL